jgi:alpha-1,6-mannosyltransferase
LPRLISSGSGSGSLLREFRLHGLEEVCVSEWRLEETARPWRGAKPGGLRDQGGIHLVDTTMLFAPRSGGVKRYLLAKHQWAQRRDGLLHSIVAPGARTQGRVGGVITLSAPLLPFGDGYRCPTNLGKWTRALANLKPDLIEAADPYVPGHAALDAGVETGAATVGFCHSDPAALAALHFGEWAAQPAQKRWARFYERFDLVIAPSRHIAQRLDESGVGRVRLQPLGVDVEVFTPERAEPVALRRRLELRPQTRLLVFAGRPAREKNLEALLGAVERLGENYRLLLIGAGRDLWPQERVISLDYERDPRQLARLLASCDAFVHANDTEPFGLIVLEAMAAGLPVVGPSRGGVAELIDEDVGQRAHHATAAGLAEAIDALFARDRPALARAARRRALERHSWDGAFEGLARIYAELLGRELPTGEENPALS